MNAELERLRAMDEPAVVDSEVVRIDRPTLHNVVVSRIRDMIIEGQLAVGMRIHEGQLGAQLGVSRTPLREALKVLANEGLVELVPGRGATVRKLTVKDAKDMLDVLILLEQIAGPITCRNASDAEIREVRRVHDEMLIFFAARDRLQYFKRNQQIHSALIALSGNESLTMVHDILQSRMRRIRFIGDRKDASWSSAVAEHEEMIAALEARDGERLSRAMMNHLTQSWVRIHTEI